MVTDFLILLRSSRIQRATKYEILIFFHDERAFHNAYAYVLKIVTTQHTYSLTASLIYSENHETNFFFRMSLGIKQRRCFRSGSQTKNYLPCNNCFFFILRKTVSVSQKGDSASSSVNFRLRAIFYSRYSPPVSCNKLNEHDSAVR